MEAAAERPPSTRETTAAPAVAQGLLETLLENLSIADADAAEGRARKILLGLGFSARQIDGSVLLLSGRPKASFDERAQRAHDYICCAATDCAHLLWPWC